jgi:hypothetical protein
MNFAWLLVGIYQNRLACMRCIAVKIPGSAKLLSTNRRLIRLMDNPAFQVREWYKPNAREWLETLFRHLGEIRLIVDGSRIGFSHQVLMVYLIYRKRAITISWTWVKPVIGHNGGKK